ncbi:DUF1566 domain-containing protein [Limnovirga soli]|uniref:DUF1566 domain-containing protein n=1 Tax=Limnovirga soli TaxID=2656915 RepID=A0A8J8FF97_9BACT|nr:DUF1566 domain-containing protein [Limnovirga soli]NNV56985.1 DUF1566 domain-containing protein [Limnovirga soli]
MKPNLKASLIVLIFALSCTKENALQPSAVSTSSTANAATTHYLGEAFGGGIIYWIDSAAGTGLIAATENQSDAMAWNKDSSYKLIGAKGKSIGTGRINTQKIITAFGTAGSPYAALLCVNYRGGGFTDWFLPSREELYKMSLNKKYLQGLTGGNYWSSSERNSITTYLIHFHNNLKSNTNKSDTFHVRAIRTF